MKKLRRTPLLAMILSLQIACSDGIRFSGKTALRDGEAAAEEAPASNSDDLNKVPDEETKVPELPAVPGPEQASAPEAAKPLFSKCIDNTDRAIVADVYQLAVDTQALPDFSTMKPLNTVCIEQLNIIDRAFTEGFPGIANLIEWFGLNIRFRVNIPQDGAYEFTLNSDDGAILFIDDSLTIDNDGLHPQREKVATANLTKGNHQFRIKYYQGPRYRIALELLWKAPEAAARSYIPTQIMSRP